MGDDEYNDDSGTQYQIEEVQAVAELLESPPIPQGSCSVLEYFGGHTSVSGGKTLKLEGFLAHIPVVILVDSGATHNFISSKLVHSLGLIITSFQGIRIQLGDGYKVLITQQCCNISVSLGTCSFLINALVFDTGDLDMVLGMDWLQSLGEVTHNWQDLWMRFVHDGEWVTLNGVSSSLHQVAFHQWLSCPDQVRSGSFSQSFFMTAVSVGLSLSQQQDLQNVLDS